MVDSGYTIRHAESFVEDGFEHRSGLACACDPLLYSVSGSAMPIILHHNMKDKSGA